MSNITIPNNSTLSFDNANDILTITIPGSCGDIVEDKECYYDTGSKSWKTKVTKSYNRNTSSYTDALFGQLCQSQVSYVAGCDDKKDCMIGDVVKEGSCVNTTDPVKLKYPITQYPSVTGKQCIDVAKERDNNSNFVLTREGDFITVNKKCSDIGAGTVPKDCVLGAMTKEGGCAKSTDPVKMKYAITQDAVGSGKSCIEVAKTMDNNASFIPVKEGNFIVVNKKCSDISSSSPSTPATKSTTIYFIIGGVVLLMLIMFFMMKK
jgi:hypothetical protein